MQHQPHVFIDESGNLVLEWFAAEKSLTLYIAPSKDMTYLKCECEDDFANPASDTYMTDGEVESASVLNKLIAWLDK